MWYPFRGFGCPVSGCRGQQGSYNWRCSECGTQMYISDSGRIECEYGYHSDHISNWKFDCGNHGNHSGRRYLHADYQGFSYSLSSALDLMDRAGANWIAALVMDLGRQYGRM